MAQDSHWAGVAPIALAGLRGVAVRTSRGAVNPRPTAQRPPHRVNLTFA
jgi:hypothetical protein